MSRQLASLVRRRPALVALIALYAVVAGLAARTPLTVALCTVLVLSLALRVAFVVRRSHADRAESRVQVP